MTDDETFAEHITPQDGRPLQAACPHCRGVIDVIRSTDTHVLRLHTTWTGLRCEGSFTRLDQDTE